MAETARLPTSPSQNWLIGGASLIVLLIIIYPWIIALTVVSFAVGFTCIEHFDRWIKASITAGRFGTNVQNHFKEFINASASSLKQKNVIKEVTADPLTEYLEFDESKRQQLLLQQQQQSLPEVEIGLNVKPGGGGGIHVHHSLAIPEGITGSNRSSPEKTSRSSRGSPVRNLPSSAASSRRVSEDILGNCSRSNNKTPSPSKSSNHGSTPSPSLALSVEISALRVDQEFRVDVRVDKAFGRLCTTILNYYISPSWAPYETRRQLRHSVKQLLTTVAEHIHKTLLVCKPQDRVQYPPLVKLARKKLLPLLLYYVDKILRRGLFANDTDDPIISVESKRRIVLKLRKFCRQISERFLCKDDQNCKLWMELFIAVLADGVLVNVFDLGKEELPKLFADFVTNFKNNAREKAAAQTKLPSQTRNIKPGGVGYYDGGTERQTLVTDPLLESCHDETMSVKSDFSSADGNIIMMDSTASAAGIVAEKVPFLFDSFLDPPFNFEKPDQIVSRWKPTLKDVVSETDLLYTLIQYMKHFGGQQSLAYLQGVLDDYPQDGDRYCRTVLELEYLPGFSRSSLLLETLGLYKVEMAMEVSPGPDRRTSSGHARSASYGGPSNSSFREFLRIEQGIVDGLPLTESGSHLSSNSSSLEQSGGSSTSGSNSSSSTAGGATLPGAGAIEPNLAFKRRPHLEMYIAKFIKSTTKSWKQYYDPLADKLEPTKRIGIDAKSYEEWEHPEVNSRVRVFATNEDIYDTLIELVTSLMRNSPIASPFLSGLLYFLKPYLMPVFNSQIDKSLNQVLSVDLLIAVLDLISEVFEESPPPREDAEEEETNNINEMISNPEEDTSQHHNSSCTTCDPSLKSTIKSFLKNLFENVALNLIDLEYFVKCCGKNKEYIFLFFVDLLDVLVSEIVEE